MRTVYQEDSGTNKGFTLVELAIVITIIGLLIGGVLKGQEIVKNARLTSTIAQVRAIEEAVATFVDKYDYLPGDLPNAAGRLRGCNANCNPYNPGGTNAAANGIIARVNWNYSDYQARSLPHPPSSSVDEPQLFWLHLYRVGLLAGVTDDAMRLSSLPLEFGVTHPTTPLPGVGLHVGSAPSGEPPLPGSPAATGLSEGLFLYTSSRPDVGRLLPSTANLRPGDAQHIDRKIDDGRPANGTVQAYGAASCFSTSGSFVV